MPRFMKQSFEQEIKYLARNATSQEFILEGWMIFHILR